MPVEVWVSHPLINALHTMPPYPLDAHIDVVLHSIWGQTVLPGLVEQATQLQQTACSANRSVNTYFNPRPAIRSLVYALGDCTVRAYPVQPVAKPVAQLLLPVDTTDQFRLQTEDMFGEAELYVERPGTLACNRSIDSYPQLRDWALMLHSLCTDVVDAHKLLTATAAASKRVFADVLRSVYPSAAQVFPELNYHKRSPISLQWLRRYIHPADQAMIRTVLDKAAAGRDAPADQRTLSGPSLGYHEE